MIDYETSILLRMTLKQKKEVKEQSEALDIPATEFCRRKIFGLSPADTMNLNELRLAIIRMDNSISEIKFLGQHCKDITKSDWQELENILNQVKKTFDEFLVEVKRSNQLAFQKSIKEDPLLESEDDKKETSEDDVYEIFGDLLSGGNDFGKGG